MGLFDLDGHHACRPSPEDLKPLDDLLQRAETIAARLKSRGETVAVAESSTGGLISAALLAVPGASAYFLGGAVGYTRHSKRLLLGTSTPAPIWAAVTCQQSLARGSMPLDDLLPLAEMIADRLKARGETIAVVESSTGGLISAALLAVPGASAYFRSGAVAYTRRAKQLLLGFDNAALSEFRAATQAHALLLARQARAQFSATWGLGESGVAGPSGNRYGDSAGHACLAVAGPSELTVTLETGSSDRIANMQAFAAALLELMARMLNPE